VELGFHENLVWTKWQYTSCCTCGNKEKVQSYYNGIQQHQSTCRVAQKIGVRCLHIHSGTGYAITSRSLLLVLGSGWP
jgi:hypothetical protein